MPAQYVIDLLKRYSLYGVTLTNTSGNGTRHYISWTQVSRSFWGNKEAYRECTYRSSGGAEIIVFVAEEIGSPPSSFNTSGHRGMLHLGILNLELDDNPIRMFFVIHPNDWYPFQHRFKTDTLTGLLHRGAGKAAGAGSGALAGAVAGSVVPGIGTAIGAGVGALGGLAVSAIAPSLLGDYLHYLG